MIAMGALAPRKNKDTITNFFFLFLFPKSPEGDTMIAMGA